ncbi:MAG: NAD(P)/FAD-dependent oxidoreductase [Candidatus Enteromonas sp.]|nr:NAD(P)/FAD-dependent oxidoreductase [Candidatus Enteromonas sp.]
MEDIIIIGGGVIGAFVARYLSQYSADILVIEKETDVGDVTSMANSAIVHSGVDPVPGTLKAKFNVEGCAMFPSVCKELDVGYGSVGSLNVALTPEDLPQLKALAERGRENGVNVQLLSREETLAIEPNLNPTIAGSLLAPSAGIVNPFTLTVHAMENAMDNGVRLSLSEEVVSIEKRDGIFHVRTNCGQYRAKVVINCAGLGSARIAKMVEDIPWDITPRKGEYFVLDHYAPGLVKHVVFPLPTKKGKGVLVMMTTSGNYLIGPSSELTDKTDDFATDHPTLDAIKAQALQMVPSIPFGEQIRVFAGLRSTPTTHDFIIEESKKVPGFINVAGIESPGLASSPAIGKYVAETLVAPILHLQKKENFNPCVRPYVHPLRLPKEKRDALIAENPHFGEVICHCEQVTLGEIEDALSRSVPARSIRAIKKRTRAGFGKCQGGFCQPKVLLLLAKYFHISPLDVLYARAGSSVLMEESKE